MRQNFAVPTGPVPPGGYARAISHAIELYERYGGDPADLKLNSDRFIECNVLIQNWKTVKGSDWVLHGHFMVDRLYVLDLRSDERVKQDYIAINAARRTAIYFTGFRDGQQETRTRKNFNSFCRQFGPDYGCVSSNGRTWLADHHYRDAGATGLAEPEYQAAIANAIATALIMNPYSGVEDLMRIEDH
jgi:hypothetical protein